MDSNSKALQSTQNILATDASAMLARSLINQFLPNDLRNYLSSATDTLRAGFSTQHIVIIEEIDGWNDNPVYDAVETYLATRISTSMTRVRVFKRAADKEKKRIIISLEKGEEIIDTFEGIQFKWRLLCRDNNVYEQPNRVRRYELSFHKMYKVVVFSTYLPFILDRAQAIKTKERMLELYLNNERGWSRINLHHPATFDTLAMDLDLKKAVMDDLARFVERKDYYKRIGKAWKRGYLIHGPPGTGKSSLVAAMANYLNFHIYDLELTQVIHNSTLKRLLTGMANKAILVVEDIDCSIELQRRKANSESYTQGKDEKVTLSGLLNFVDGLWSSCGEERIIVFTTNYKDRLDRALLRPGRMDMHIHMDYCGVSAFETLASNYHDVDDHPLFEEIKDLIEEIKVTPAEVAGELTTSCDAENALRGLIKFLHEKRERSTEYKTKNHEECDLVSNVSNGEQHCYKDSPHEQSPWMLYNRDCSRLTFGGRGYFRGRGGYLPSFRGRGAPSRVYRGRGGPQSRGRRRGHV